MRVERVIENYKRIRDNSKIEEVYKDILSRYSDASITASEVAFLLKNKKGLSYEPAKIGLSALEKKAYNSKCMREKIALSAASIICTDRYELEAYENLALILDYSGTPEADRLNEQIAGIMIHGGQKEKEDVFRNRLKPLMNIKESTLEWKNDDELVEHWDELEVLLYQFIDLDKIIEEAMQTGMTFSSDVLDKIKAIHGKVKLPAEMILYRAGVIANAYYAQINDADLRKIDCEILKEIKEDTAFVFRDYLEDVIALAEGYDYNIQQQMNSKLSGMGYDNPNQVVFANIRGRQYSTEEAISVLKAGRIVYLLDENKKLSQVLEMIGPDGFLKPVSTRKRDLDMKKYLDSARNMIYKMVKDGHPLSPEEEKAARKYMATMVCFEKLMGERKLGNIRLWQTVGSDEKKFSRAIKNVYEDKRFQLLTKNITVESLRDFISNKGEKKLSEQYTSMIVADNHKRAAEDICLP